MTVNQKTTLATGKRFYTWRDEAYWSVTTILGGGLPKPALLPWGIKSVAEGAVDAMQRGILAAMVEQDPDNAVRYLKGLPYAQRDKAADLGTFVHAAAEAYALGKPFPTWPPLVKPRMEAFVQFLADYKPAYEMTEASVFNKTERYAGTLDAIAMIAGRRILLDTKTGKGVYPESALQCSAYAHCEFVALPDGSEAPMPKVDGAAVLHLPETGGYQLIEVRIDDEVFRSFLYVRECFRFLETIGKTVLLGPFNDLALAVSVGAEAVAS